MDPSAGRVTLKGTFDGYELAGWRDPDHASWHVKAWLAGSPRDWIGYTVTAGLFEVKANHPGHKQAILRAIGEWETGVPQTSEPTEPAEQRPPPANLIFM